MTRFPRRFAFFLAALAGSALLWALLSGPGDGPVPAPVQSGDSPAEGAPIPAAAAPAAPAAAAAAAEEAAAGRTASEAASPGAWAIRGHTVIGKDQVQGGLRFRLSLRPGLKVLGEPIAEIELVSAEEGSFVWAVPPPGGNVTIVATPTEEGYYPYSAWTSIRIGEEPPADLLVRFHPLDFRIAGTVRDHEGRALAGARVEVARIATQADANGRYEIAVALFGSSTFLHASAEGYERARMEVERPAGGEPATADFVLRPEFRIEGRVLDEAGQPVVDASVQTFFSMGFAVRSAADGSFAVDHLDPSRGSHHLYARKEGYVEGGARVTAAIGSVARQDLVLKRGVRLEGKVVDEAGNPLVGVELYLGDGPSMYDRLDAETDAQGRFVFPAVPCTVHTLVTQFPGWAPDRRQVDLREAPDRAEPLAIVLGRGCHAAGTVVDEAGEPLPGVHLSAKLNREYLENRTQTDEEGRFRLEGLPAENLSLELYSRGRVRTEEELPPGSHDDLVLCLPSAGRIAGKVVDGVTGQAVKEFRIRFFFPLRLGPGRQVTGGWGVGWSDEGHVFRDPEGLWDSGEEELTAGRYLGVEASAAGYGITRMDEVLVEKDPAPGSLRLELFLVQPLRGRVVAGAEGVPVEGARVRCQPADRPLRMGSYAGEQMLEQVTITGADGAFAFDAVAAGELSLLVDHSDWAPAVDGPFEVRPAIPIPEREIRLSSGAAIHGFVRDPDGLPIAGAEVELTARGGSFESLVLRVTTSDSGAFRFGHLPPGDYHLRHLDREGPHTAWLATASLHLSEGEDAEVELRPPGTATVIGELLSAGEIPPMLMVMARSSRESGDRSEALELSTLARNGRFQLRGLSAGHWVLNAGPFFGPSGSVTVELAPGGQATVQIVLE